MPEPENDPVAIVTGAGRGIGRAAAIELSGRGYRLVLASRSRGDLDRTAEELGGEASVVAGDVTDPAFPAKLVEAATEGFGRLDAVVHCAGLAPMLPIGQTDDATLDGVLATNLTALYRLARAAWPALTKSGGAVVAVSSQAARDPLTPFTAYAAAKSAVNGLVLALAREGGPEGVRAYAVAPGAVETQMLRAILDETQVPPEITLDPTDVADVIAYCLCGPLRHSSGETIYLKK